MLTSKLGQRGDTIVEVLIAIALASLMLAGAYVTTNKSSQQIISSQERGEAQRLASSAVESLDEIVAENPSYVASTQPDTFCINGNNVFTAKTAGSAPTLPPLGSDDFTSYASQCRGGGGGVAYYTAIERTTSGTAPNEVFTFTVHTRWDGVGGSREEATISYRTQE